MDVHSYMADLMVSKGEGGTGRPVGRPKGPEKEKLPAIHVRDVPPTVKDALAALMEVGTIGFDEDGLSLRSTYGSQGDAAKTLMVYGMAHIAPYMAKQLESERQAGEVHSAIVRAFLDDMSLSFVTEANFPEGSAAHEEMLSIKHDTEADQGENAWLCHGLSRREALDQASMIQFRFDRLSRALRAVEAAVTEHLGNRKKL
jgi:hypothetical protein